MLYVDENLPKCNNAMAAPIMAMALFNARLCPPPTPIFLFLSKSVLKRGKPQALGPRR